MSSINIRSSRSNIGLWLRKRLREALSEFADQNAHFEALTRSLDATNVHQWKKQVEDWEADYTLEDPYQVIDLGEFEY